MQYYHNLLSNQYLIILICISFSIFLGLIIFGLSYILAVQNPDSENFCI